jgi:hypothetical protein
MSKTLDEDIKILETSIFETAEKFNFTQTGIVLFDKKNGVKQKKTKPVSMQQARKSL